MNNTSSAIGNTFQRKQYKAAIIEALARSCNRNDLSDPRINDEYADAAGMLADAMIREDDIHVARLKEASDNA